MAKFHIPVVVSCAISANADVSSITAPQIFTFSVYARVPEFARSSRTSFNT